MQEMKALVLALVVVLVHCAPAPLEDFLAAPEYIRAHGYPSEDHPVVTPDGYVLGVHRIPRGRSQNGVDQQETKDRPVVVLLHGIISSSSSFLFGSTSKSLGFLLADNGFDVWMSNSRGNVYSQRHVTKNHDDPTLYDFSLDEMALIDLPTVLDYIKMKTGQEKVSVVGHSMGTTILFAAMAAKPELNSRIKVMVAMAPVANLTHMVTPILQAMAPMGNDLVNIIERFGIYRFAPYNEVISWLESYFCGFNENTKAICQYVVSMVVGFDIPQWDQETLLAAAATHPAGTSFRALLHFGQMVMSGKFQRYDFGPDGNKEHYGQVSPPQYPLSNVTAPIALFWGLNDWVADPEDVTSLDQQLPNVVKSQQVDWPTFSHLDFIFAKDVVDLLYKDIFDILREYN